MEFRESLGGFFKKFEVFRICNLQSHFDFFSLTTHFPWDGYCMYCILIIYIVSYISLVYIYISAYLMGLSSWYLCVYLMFLDLIHIVCILHVGPHRCLRTFILLLQWLHKNISTFSPYTFLLMFSSLLIIPLFSRKSAVPPQLGVRKNDANSSFKCSSVGNNFLVFLRGNYFWN